MAHSAVIEFINPSAFGLQNADEMPFYYFIVSPSPSKGTGSLVWFPVGDEAECMWILVPVFVTTSNLV